MTARVRVERDGFSLSTLESGQGPGAPAVLLTNSLGAGLGMWDAQRELLGRSRRVIGYDARGHGRSGTPPAPYGFDDLVGDALAVLDHFAVDRVDYVGLSLGGMTGLGLGLRAPERLNRLVCAAARADAPPAFVQGWDDRVAAIAQGGLAAIWPATLDRWLTRAARDADPEAARRLEAEFKPTTVEGYTGCAAALKTLDYLRRLGDLRVPTLFIAGSEDQGAPAAAMEAMAAATPGARYVCIPNAAHIVNVNAPAAFNAAIGAFLEVP